jgi:hypothetical protein
MLETVSRDPLSRSHILKNPNTTSVIKKLCSINVAVTGFARPSFFLSQIPKSHELQKYVQNPTHTDDLCRKEDIM